LVGAFARALGSTVIRTGCPIAAPRGSMPPISYGTETMPQPTPAIGPNASTSYPIF